MPTRRTQTKIGTHQVLRNISYESRVISWLLHDGWQIFNPLVDHGHQTDILVSDGPNYYRVQVKTVEACSQNQVILNQWKGSHVNIVVVFARNSNWGFVLPAFAEGKRKLNAEGHEMFLQNRGAFLKAFHRV